MNQTSRIAVTLLLGVAFVLVGSGNPARAEDRYDPDMTRCSLRYNLKGWSSVYKQADGTGTITCTNGESAEVVLKTRGGGVTFGKSEIIGGSGTFSEVRDISETFGMYAQAEAHGGVTKSAAANVMTKGEVSLALAGTGHGVDLGFAFGAFIIERKPGQTTGVQGLDLR